MQTETLLTWPLTVTRVELCLRCPAEIAEGSEEAEELSGAEIPEVLSTAAPGLKDVAGLSTAIVQGQLKNCEMLSKLDECYAHLNKPQLEDVVGKTKWKITLFSDVLTNAVSLSTILM